MIGVEINISDTTALDEEELDFEDLFNYLNEEEIDYECYFVCAIVAYSC